MHPTDAAGIANSVDPDHSSLIWVCTVCPDLSVRKHRIIRVVVKKEGHFNMNRALLRVRSNTEATFVTVMANFCTKNYTDACFTLLFSLKVPNPSPSFSHQSFLHALTPPFSHLLIYLSISQYCFMSSWTF